MPSICFTLLGDWETEEEPLGLWKVNSCQMRGVLEGGLATNARLPLSLPAVVDVYISRCILYCYVEV